MTRFAGRKGDLTWGRFDYPVTRTQKATLDGLWHMMNGLPRGYEQRGSYALPEGGFYSQRPDTGDVVIGLHHHSVNVHRNGRITGN
jgi:hypothetical protein